MNRRRFLGQSALNALIVANLRDPWLRAQELEIERGAPAPDPIPEPHFPDRLHLFVWRNWELANTDRMAGVLGTTPEKVLEIGASMGLPPKPHLTDDQLRRIHITVIRQNWHVLPDDQLIDLLGWDSQHYQYTLKEDDFLWAKLGLLRPRCLPLRYEEPSPAARQRAAEIRRLVRETFGPSLDETGEPAFQFVADLSSARTPFQGSPVSRPAEGELDLSRGWLLKKPSESSGIPGRLLGEFQAYLQSAFGCEIGLTEETRPASKLVEFRLDASIARPSGSFKIDIQPEEIRLTGRDLSGVRQGLYFLQDQMEARQGPYLAKGSVLRTTRLDPRYVYSYFALYGDPLLETKIDPFPKGFLEKLARAGVNGVWLQAVLRTLAPSKSFPEFGEGWEARLKNLARLVERARDYGMKIYLYLNEPRLMPAQFFARHPQIKGTYDGHDPAYFAMCTSTAEVREWIADSLAHVFAQVPGLGGVFTITASENLTNCYSHGRAQFCARCSQRPGAEVIAEVIQTFRDGVRRASAGAEVMAWDWGWGNDWIRNGADSAGVIERLPQDVALLSVSEWDRPVDRGGCHTRVGEYSISVVGPGPRALRNWGLARERGLTTLAKVQWSSTWEISAVPYIPVPNMIAQHCENLLKAGVQGLMASWTVGGYPSPNFEAARGFYFSPSPGAGEVLRQVAERRYGKEAAPAVLEAWKIFSKAFEEFPFGLAIYNIPSQHGPANPLRLRPTGYRASMMLFPYDDYKTWAGPYPVEIVEKQFEKIAELWKPGLAHFRGALPRVPAPKRAAAHKDLGVAETCCLHFQSVANQVRFYRLRAQRESAPLAQRPALALRMIEIAESEMQLAKHLYTLARRDSTIAYEASNQYYYRPLDLVEKVLNYRHVIESLTGREGARAAKGAYTWTTMA